MKVFGPTFPVAQEYDLCAHVGFKGIPSLLDNLLCLQGTEANGLSRFFSTPHIKWVEHEQIMFKTACPFHRTAPHM